MGGFTLPPFPQLLPVELTTPIELDPPPTYSDVWATMDAEVTADIAELDVDIANELLLVTEFGVELALGDADVAALDGLSVSDAAPYDTSGLDAIDLAFGGVQADGAAVCSQLTQVLIQTGVAPTGNCDAAATPTPTQPVQSGTPTNSPYPVNPNPPPNGDAGCSQAPYSIDLFMALPDAVVGQAPIVVRFGHQYQPGIQPAIYGPTFAFYGPSDMAFTFVGEQYQTYIDFNQTFILILYPARTGSFNWTLPISFDAVTPPPGQKPNSYWVCVSLNVNPSPTETPLPPATPSAPSDLLATVAGAATAPNVIDLGTFNLGDPPSKVSSPNSQWATAKSALYGDGTIVGGPSDMLVTSGAAHDPASVNAYILYTLIVMPIRVGTWAWLVQFWEDGAQTIPFYICFTATVQAGGGGTVATPVQNTGASGSGGTGTGSGSGSGGTGTGSGSGSGGSGTGTGSGGSGSGTAPVTVDANSCQDGFVFDTIANECVPYVTGAGYPAPLCAPGWVWSDAVRQCVWTGQGTPPAAPTPPSGYKWSDIFQGWIPTSYPGQP